MPLGDSRLRLIRRVILVGCITQQTQIDSTNAYKFTLYKFIRHYVCVYICIYHTTRAVRLMEELKRTF